MTDILIIGAGPAGINAAIYAARKELSVKVISTDVGGQMLLTRGIENYLGMKMVTGFELADKMEEHMKEYPIDMVYASVQKVEKTADGTFLLDLDDGQQLEGKAVIVTSGKHSRTLDIPGEMEFTGRGISYCATCDGPFYKNKVTAVVGGGDSAVQGALELSKICPKVYLVVRSRIRADEILVRRLEQTENVEQLIGYTPERIAGEGKIEALIVKNREDGSEKTVSVDGVFVEVGGIPNTGYLPEELKKNSQGEIITAKDGSTSMPGLFAAGDVTDGKYKQIIIAAGEGATAALSAHEYLLRNGR